jgi:septal ring factor EnvC (AmiA/AmiB activator)
MSFWERAWATFVSDPTTVIGIGVVCIAASWWFRGFLHKERMQFLKDQLSQAQRDADTSTSKFIRAEAKFAELQNQLAAHAPVAQIEATAKSTAAALDDLKTANAVLQHTLTLQGGRYGITGNDVKFTVTTKSE